MATPGSLLFHAVEPKYVVHQIPLNLTVRKLMLILQFRVYYEDDKSYLAELVGVPEPGGGFTWSRWNPEMQDGKPLQLMKKSTIAATSVGLLRVFLVAPGGEVIQAYCDSNGWNSVLVNGDD